MLLVVLLVENRIDIMGSIYLENPARERAHPITFLTARGGHYYSHCARAGTD